MVVVGGGLTGSAAATALAGHGLGVVLLDQFGPGSPRPDGDRAEVLALQEAAALAGAVVRHHRRVTAVEPDGAGVLVRSAAGAVVRAGVAVVATGAWTDDVLAGGLVLERVGSVLLAAGTGGTAAMGRLLGQVSAHPLESCAVLA